MNNLEAYKSLHKFTRMFVGCWRDILSAVKGMALWRQIPELDSSLKIKEAIKRKKYVLSSIFQKDSITNNLQVNRIHWRVNPLWGAEKIPRVQSKKNIFERKSQHWIQVGDVNISKHKKELLRNIFQRIWINCKRFTSEKIGTRKFAQM